MLVTDKLTGFEIKSDSDNYERLSKQITSYNQFFDENYIVVGTSHKKSIESKIRMFSEYLSFGNAISFTEEYKMLPKKSFISSLRTTLLFTCGLAFLTALPPYLYAVA